MPKYDFVCMNCDTTVELRVAIDATDIQFCKLCGNKMIKSYTPPAVHFKGGGWGGQ